VITVNLKLPVIIKKNTIPYTMFSRKNRAVFATFEKRKTVFRYWSQFVAFLFFHTTTTASKIKIS
jgi:hypothetical protein